MRLYFWILSIVCISAAQEPWQTGTTTPPSSSEDARAIVEEVKKTMHTAFQVVNLYDDVDKHVPWQEFKSILSDFEKHTKYYSDKSAPLVGDIKTNIMNAIDAYIEASRHITEWSSLMMPLLRTHLKLFTDFNSAKAKAQNRLLQKLLDDGVQRTKVAQVELEKIFKNLDDADRKLHKLSAQLNLEFDEGSEIFKKRLARVIQKNTKKINKKNKIKIGKAKLKGRLAFVQNLFKKLTNLVENALENGTYFQDEMKTQIEHLKDESKALSNYDTIVDNPVVLESTAKATENLIDKCNEYIVKHKLIQM